VQQHQVQAGPNREERQERLLLLGSPKEHHNLRRPQVQCGSGGCTQWPKTLKSPWWCHWCCSEAREAIFVQEAALCALHCWASRV